ncbi:MAG: cation diffusion facilitator family transporter [Anaerolineae bacterium]
MKSGSSERPITVYGAIAANLVIAVTKFAAGFATGSSAMLSEGIHSSVDTGNQLLLLLGLRQSAKPADDQHPFGHGPDLYFWSLIVAMLIFGLGGGMSIYEGITHLQHPSELGAPTWNYVVLAIAFVVEGAAFGIALRELLRQRRPEESFWQALRSSKDPTVYTVLAEDAAALSGIVIAVIGVYLAHRFENPVFDGAASIVIGLVLATVAVFLAYESRSLLVGESAYPNVVQGIQRLAAEDEGVRQVRRPWTMHLGPRELLLTMEIDFSPDLSAAGVAAAVDRLESQIRQNYPQVKHIFIEAESLSSRRPAAAS